MTHGNDQMPGRRIGGFTLIEVMIVVVIVGILAAIAFPSYAQYVERSRRADGTSAIMDAAQRLERCYTQANTYVGCVVFPIDSPDGFYQLAAPTMTATTFTLTATPQGPQATSPCGVLSLTHNGVRAAGAANCW